MPIKLENGLSRRMIFAKARGIPTSIFVSRHHTIMPAPQESQVLLVPENLQLLTDFIPDMSIGRVPRAQVRFESIHVIQSELLRAGLVDTRDHIQEPAPGIELPLVPQEPRPSPRYENTLLRLSTSVIHKEDAASLRNVLYPDIASDPPRAARLAGKRLPFLDERGHEKLWGMAKKSKIS
jgi:hypothetical protein